jgi:hypothetical protein
MKTLKIIISVLIILSANLFAQQQKVIKMLAVMVDFQEDNDEATTGTGKFGSIYKKYKDSTNIIDPLPFDYNYFYNHLLFAKNYYQKITNNQLSIDVNLLNDIITADKKMREYSPAVKSNDFSLMVDLSSEIWAKVKNKYNVNFNDYDIFLIFHAGVGRDVEVPGSLGYSRDLPSVYLSNKIISNSIGSKYFPKNKQGLFNTIICPSTDNREIDNFGAITLLNLSINGLIVSSIASHLGLPDLFNTKTGTTAIGRFGLMDGQSIFTYGGAFLPEPSAWEKLKLYEILGLNYPGFYEINLNDGKIKKVNLKTRNCYSFGDTTILKVKISDDEYFLIENRNRDAKKDKIKITTYFNNQYQNLNFEKDDKGFYSYDVKKLKGVITDIDELDWALPGSGIAIWYIDEKVIREKSANNEINADINNRGIYLVEADGVYDIGYSYETPFGTSVGDGEEYDLWFNGNKAKLYKNIFNNDSKPSTKTKDNIPTYIEISNFSASDSSMSFNIQLKNSVKLLKEFSLTSSKKDYKIHFANDSLAVIYDKDSIYCYKNGDKLLVSKFENFLPAVGKDIIVLPNLRIYDFNLNLIKIIPHTEVVTSSVTINYENNNPIIYSGLADGTVLKYNHTSNSIDNLKISNYPIKQVIVSGNDIFTLNSNDEVYKNSVKVAQGTKIDKIIYNSEDIVTVGNNQLSFKNSNLQIPNSNIAFGDFDKTGNASLIYFNGKEILAKKYNGTVTTNFPLISYVSPVCKKIITFDFNNDGYTDFIYSVDNKIVIKDTKNLQRDYIVITVGDTIRDFYLNENSKLFVLKDNIFKQYNIENLSNYQIIWQGDLANSSNTAIFKITNNKFETKEFFPKKYCYNWPNPVYDGITYIRYLTSEDSDIKIKIIDLSGMIVKEIFGKSYANVEGEVKVELNNLGSGIYYASVEAVSNISGKKSINIIKIALVK